MSAALTESQLHADHRAIFTQIRERLQNAGVPYHDLSVFGVIRCNVHVRCISHDTAIRWQHLLAQAFKVKVSVVSTAWNAADNRGTNLRPTMIRGYLIGCAF